MPNRKRIKIAKQYFIAPSTGKLIDKPTKSSWSLAKSHKAGWRMEFGGALVVIAGKWAQCTVYESDSEYFVQSSGEFFYADSRKDYSIDSYGVSTSKMNASLREGEWTTWEKGKRVKLSAKKRTTATKLLSFASKICQEKCKPALATAEKVLEAFAKAGVAVPKLPKFQPVK